MEQEFYIPKLELVPICLRPVRRPQAVADHHDQYDLPHSVGRASSIVITICSGTANGAYGNSPKGGVFPWNFLFRVNL